MAIQYVFPVAATLEKADRDLLPVLTASDPIYRILPVVNKDSANVVWEQGLPFRGMMQIRGYEAEFPSVPGVGLNRFSVPPGIYGEHAPIGEQEITERRGYGSFNLPIDISDLVNERHMMLATRHFNRMSWIGWTLLAQGIYQVVGPTGAVLKRDGFTPQMYFAGTGWGTIATSTPLADMRAVSLLHRGHSVTFGATANAYMNLVTFNHLISNTNTSDLGNSRQTGLFKPVGGLAALNELITNDNLPNIVVHDEGYTSDGTDGFAVGTFFPFIPDNIVIVVGTRTNGAALGEFQMTRNASNPNVSPGPIVRVVDEGADENTAPPRKISVFRGFNGGPAIRYSTAFVVMVV
jgi:hypothetical protein